MCPEWSGRLAGAQALRCEERPHARQVVSNCSNLESVSPGKKWTLRLLDAVPSPRSFRVLVEDRDHFKEDRDHFKDSHWKVWSRE